MTVSVDLDMAKRYRLHAVELRLLAADPTCVQISSTLLNLVADYEQMAERLEAVDKTNQAMARRLEN